MRKFNLLVRSLKKKSIFISVYIIGVTHSNYLAAILLSNHLLQRLRNQIKVYSLSKKKKEKCLFRKNIIVYFILTRYENLSIIRNLEELIWKILTLVNEKEKETEENWLERLACLIEIHPSINWINVFPSNKFTYAQTNRSFDTESSNRMAP